MYIIDIADMITASTGFDQRLQVESSQSRIMTMKTLQTTKQKHETWFLHGLTARVSRHNTDNNME